MNELQQILVGDSAAVPPKVILEGLTDAIVRQVPEGAPHSIYEELWHLAFWQRVTLDWVNGIETPFPVRPSDGFPDESDAACEDWAQVRRRFLSESQQAAALAGDDARLGQPVRCPSRPGMPMRTMTVREQLESLGAHNAYHLGRIVLLRQLLRTWPPVSGGFSW
jgi:uncharacterized damage-inducible protein DinB